MLKLKKMLRISLVGCIAVSTLMIGAGAVVTDTAPKLAECAGETVTCNVNIANADGIFAQQAVDIVIPDDATEAEANALIEQSAEAVATQHIAMPRNYGSYDLYTGEGRVLNLVSSGYGSVIADVIVDDKGDYYMMGVFFSDISPYVQTVNCSIMDTEIGTTQSYFLGLSPTGSSNRRCEALFMTGEPTDGKEVFDFYTGQHLNFYGSCTLSNGSFGIADVVVKGYYTF